MTEKNQTKTSSASPNLGRHRAGCRICAHPHRQEIEEQFIAWGSPTKIARDYGLRDRSSVHRHARALNLNCKRTQNLHAALEKIIERVDEVKVNAAAVIQAVVTYARINSLSVSPEQICLNDSIRLIDQMTPEETEMYARESVAPRRLTQGLVATHEHSPKGRGDRQDDENT
jgi:hypothetical protein